MPPPGRPQWLHVAERAAWAIGLILVLAAGGWRLAGTRAAAQDVTNFRSAAQTPPIDRPDMTLWSPERVHGWEDSLRRPPASALAVLRIPKIKLEVPILEGTDEWTLTRAVGHIEDTARPGTPGNLGIAGHRDGFFRGLKDVGVGDAIDVELPGATQHYQIEQIWTVKPEDVWVLNPTPQSAVTLVTCYPFYYVGSAPQRYIVRAVRSATVDVAGRRH